MKAFLLATAMIAAPVIAQSSTMTQPPAETTTTETTTTDTTTTDTTAPATTMDPAQTAQPGTGTGAPGQPAPGSGAAMGANTAAEGQAMQAQTPAPAGAPNVVFQQPQSVEQAFPAPAPKASYPVCSRTVTDGCRQRVDPK